MLVTLCKQTLLNLFLPSFSSPPSHTFFPYSSSTSRVSQKHDFTRRWTNRSRLLQFLTTDTGIWCSLWLTNIACESAFPEILLILKLIPFEFYSHGEYALGIRRINKYGKNFDTNETDKEEDDGRNHRIVAIARWLSRPSISGQVLGIHQLDAWKFL